MKHHVLVDLDQQYQNCAEHHGEQKRFYCETCDKPVCRDCILLKQCCRDHDTVPIKQASDKHVSHLKESVQTCREKKEELGVNLTESGSPYVYVSNYRSVLSRKQKVNDIEVNEVDETLADIPTPIVECVFGKQWETTGQIKVTCKYDAGLTGIDVTSNGNIALREAYGDQVHVYSRSGDFKHTFKSTRRFDGYGDVAITPSDVYVIPSSRKYCKLYNSQYKLISKFDTCNANDESSVAVAVTVDKDGCIILGMKDNAISIHNTDGSVKSRFAIPYQPMSVAVTSKPEIIVASDNNTFQLSDYSGQSILTLNPPPDITTWMPCYVCCSKRDEVFVVNRGDPLGIYKYTAGGVYMGCITTQVTGPWGIALSHDDKELYVTESNWDSKNNFIREVKIFQRL